MEHWTSIETINTFNGGDFHRYLLFGQELLVSRQTGAIYHLDAKSAHLLDACADLAAAGKKGDLRPWSDEHAVIKELGELAQAEAALAAAYAAAAEEQTQAFAAGDFVVKSLCLHIAHDCNLRCKYCFAGTGPFGGDRSLMSFEVGRQAIDFLLAASGPRQHLEIDFFGGEPLLNWPVVVALLSYGRRQAKQFGKTIRFTLTTNALGLQPAMLDLLRDEGVSLILSLDGRPEIHNRMRPYPNGRGSQPAVLRKIKTALVRFSNDYWVRGTYTRYNLDFTNDVLYLLEQGITNISLEPVVAPASAPYALSFEDLPQIEAEYERLAGLYLERHALGKPFNFFHFNLDLATGPCLVKRMLGCGAGHEFLAVAPDGTLYPCHQFVGQKAFRIGTVFSGLENTKRQRQFRTNHVFAKAECEKCWARFYCSGGCHANAYYNNGTIAKPYALGCAIEKKRLECAFVIQAFLAERSKVS